MINFANSQFTASLANPLLGWNWGAESPYVAAEPRDDIAGTGQPNWLDLLADIDP